MKLKFVCALACPLLLLAGCEDEVVEDAAVETGGEAAGEVLGGTISDDMLPLEELTSTSPPAERVGSQAGGAGVDAGTDEPGGEMEEAEAPEEAPAPEPVSED